MSVDNTDLGPEAALLRLLPHRPPFLLLDSVDVASNTEAQGFWQVPKEHPLVNGAGCLEPVALAEIMAQCFAALGIHGEQSDGLSDGLNSDAAPALGYLAALRDVRFLGQAKAGDTLEVRVRVTASLGQICVVQGQVHSAGFLLAEGQCKVFIEQAE